MGTSVLIIKAVRTVSTQYTVHNVPQEIYMYILVYGSPFLIIFFLYERVHIQYVFTLVKRCLVHKVLIT